MENGREIEGPQEFYMMSHKEYRDMITTRDEKERKEAERLQRERELLELRRKKQLERAAAFAKLQGVAGSMRLDLAGTMQEVYEKQSDNAKIAATYKPSKLPIRIVKTARQSYRAEKNELLTTGKVFKYEVTSSMKERTKKRSERPESLADEFNKNLLTYEAPSAQQTKGKNEKESTAKVKLPVKQERYAKASTQKKFLAPPPLGRTMGHGLMTAPGKSKSPAASKKAE